MTDFVAALARKWADAYTDSGPELLLVDALAAAIHEALEEAEKCVPANWLDPLLTGASAILHGHGPWDGRQIERLLREVTARITALREGR